MAIIHVHVILFAKPKEFQMLERLINNFDKHLDAFQGQLYLVHLSFLFNEEFFFSSSEFRVTKASFELEK